MTELDHDILIRCKQKELPAFQKLVDFYQPYAHALAYRFLMDKEESKDIVQETFIRIWKHIERYDLNIRFSTWLYRIVSNLCLDRIRQTKRRSETGLMQADGQALQLPDQDADLQSRYELKERVMQVHQMARRLPKKQHQVFVMRDLQNMDLKDIADALKISVNSVKSNLSHARKTLRLALWKMEKKESTHE